MHRATRPATVATSHKGILPLSLHIAITSLIHS
jgi:hypothetical protein